MKKALTSKYSTLRACLRSENYHQWRKATAAHRLLAPGCCGEDAFREGQGIISYPGSHTIRRDQYLLGISVINRGDLWY